MELSVEGTQTQNSSGGAAAPAFSVGLQDQRKPRNGSSAGPVPCTVNQYTQIYWLRSAAFLYLQRQAITSNRYCPHLRLFTSSLRFIVINGGLSNHLQVLLCTPGSTPPILTRLETFLATSITR